MRLTTRTITLGLALLFIVGSAPGGALATPAITCHCFTDRSYDPARPTVADPYFLATTQNSFFAAAFGVDKKSIVVKKQKGASADELWVAYWLAARSGADAEALLKERKNRGSWQKVAGSLAIADKSLGARFVAALKAKASDERLAAAVVDELLFRFRFHGEAELSALRTAGAGNKEMILAGLLAARVRQPATQLYLDVKNGGTSWGGLLQRAGIVPAQIQSEVATRITAAAAARSK